MRGIHIKSRINRKTKYWKIASRSEFVERQRYIYKDGIFKGKSALWRLLHDINIGWKDEVPTERKQYTLKNRK
jgi:hypothetical protein